jgi:hypothetical protein
MVNGRLKGTAVPAGLGDGGCVGHLLEAGIVLNVIGIEKLSPALIISEGGIGNGCGRSIVAMAARSSTGNPLLLTICVDNK